MSLQAKVDQALCSCPSDGGSLRWPCVVHPPGLSTAGLTAAETEVLQVAARFNSVSLFGLYDHCRGVKSADVQQAVTALMSCKLLEARNYKLGRAYLLTSAGRHLLKSITPAVTTAAPGANA